MSNKNFTLTYDELLLLLKDAYRNGYSTYEMADAGLEPFDDDGYARWVLLGMENNKQEEEIIKKWEESGLLDGLTEMDKDHPMLKVLEANGKQRINELPDVKPMMEKNKQEEEQIMDTMCQQLKIEVNASETQKYYKSKEVQDLDNPTDVVYDYETELCFTKQDYDKKLLMDFTPKIYEWIMKPPFNLEHAQHGLACEKFGDVRTDFLKKRSLGNQPSRLGAVIIWVDVTDALPKIASENYLVVKNGIVSISLFRGDWNEFQCDLNDFQKVTHWSECPKPPCL